MAGKNKYKLLLFPLSVALIIIATDFSLAFFSDTHQVSSVATTGNLAVSLTDPSITKSDGLPSSLNFNDINTIKWTINNIGLTNVSIENKLKIAWDNITDLKEQGLIFVYPEAYSDEELKDDILNNSAANAIVNQNTLDNTLITFDDGATLSGIEVIIEDYAAIGDVYLESAYAEGQKMSSSDNRTSRTTSLKIAFIQISSSTIDMTPYSGKNLKIEVSSTATGVTATQWNMATITSFLLENANVPQGIRLASLTLLPGDYVTYDAGTWYETKSLPSDFEFGGYNNGTSKNDSVACYGLPTSGLNGWRVLANDGENVTLIHAGQSECYRHNSLNTLGYSAVNSELILSGTNLLGHPAAGGIPYAKRDFSTYMNSYAESVTIFNKQHLDNYTNTTTSLNDIFNDDLINTETFYYLGTAESVYTLYTLENDKLYTYDASGGAWTFGVRPVITLKSDTRTTGKAADSYGHTAWSLAN